MRRSRVDAYINLGSSTRKPVSSPATAYPITSTRRPRGDSLATDTGVEVCPARARPAEAKGPLPSGGRAF